MAINPIYPVKAYPIAKPGVRTQPAGSFNVVLREEDPLPHDNVNRLPDRESCTTRRFEKGSLVDIFI